MSTDNFDKEISQLYQQRKDQITAPIIHSLAKVKPPNRKLSLARLLIVFVTGGVASFGIMAIISHLAKTPEQGIPSNNANYQIEIAEEKVVQPYSDSVITKTTLPEKPSSKSPETGPNAAASQQSNPAQVEAFKINVEMTQIVTLPQLKEPTLLINPTYKVMPKYSAKAMHAKQSGAIKLRYQINEQGVVENIDVIESSVNRELQKSAKHALAKWRYAPSQGYSSSYEIIFDFKLK